MKKKHSLQPELLLPVGNNEAFHAAIKGGADAIYLGLKDFNARGRATNFSPWQLAAIIKESHQKNVKVYVTLNTVIRNTEINQLCDTLFILSQVKPDAIIIQDWGVYYIARKFFPNLTLHASTQMANHNSVGVNSASKMGFERVVLARELTKTEIQSITEKSKAEIELFIHGALCYSFSGMCLFSSFLGGASANRGQCTQPCRRNYTQNKKESYFFSLKDNQLIDHLPFLEKLKIDSLKVEGRIKSAEYVYQVATAYRKALDHPDRREEAKAQLQFDMGREKTEYFLGKNVGEAITQASNTGLFLGTVTSSQSNTIVFDSNIQLESAARFRFRNPKDDHQTVLKVANLEQIDEGYRFRTDNKEIHKGDEVYLAGMLMKFPGKINTDGIRVKDHYSSSKQRSVIQSIKHKDSKKKQEIILRIDSLNWLRKLRLEDFDNIILNLTKKELGLFNPELPFLQKNRQHIHIELPRFIAEEDLNHYQKIITRIFNAGFKSFYLSHLSQKELLPKGARFSTNENVYLFNDAAIQVMKDEGVQNYIYPLENDIVNMAKGSDRDGIIPVYFYPWLFYSRMPVKLEKEELFTDKTGASFTKYVRDGITIIIPEHPVSLTQYKEKLERYGFHRFLIDLTAMSPSKNTPKTIKKRLLNSEQIQPASNFNFKRELK